MYKNIEADILLELYLHGRAGVGEPAVLTVFLRRIGGWDDLYTVSKSTTSAWENANQACNDEWWWACRVVKTRPSIHILDYLKNILAIWEV